MRSVVTKYLCFGLVVGLSFACQNEPLHQESNLRYSKSSRRIIGGAPDLRHPAVGALTRNRGKFCTGTLVTPKLVITAGHCISSSNIQFRIDKPTGSGNRFTSTYHDVASVHVHPGYRGSGRIQNDLAMLVLKNPVTGVTPIPISANTMDSSWVGRKILYWGYGVISTNPQRSTNTKYHVAIALKAVSSDRFEANERGKSICFGDSGGPALYTINGQLMVIGVNSYVPNRSCNGGSFCFRTDAYYQSYLQKFLQQYGGICKSDSDCTQCQRCDTGTGKCVPRNVPALPKLCKACKTNADCGGSGATCVQRPEGNRCVQPCSANGCCPAGYSCQSGNCTPDSGKCPDVSCTSDSDCGTGESCKNGFCRRPGRDLFEDCNAGAPCLPGLICIRSQIGRSLCFRDCSTNSSCQPEGGACLTSNNSSKLCLCNMSDRPCNPGYTCKLTTRNGVCVKNSSGGNNNCTRDSDCPAGQVCRNGKCEQSSQPQCTRDSDCPAGQVCRNGKCEQGSQPQCTRDTDCPTGQVCRNNKCEPSSNPGCRSDADCPVNHSCVNSTCIPQRQCSQDPDCPTGQVCRSGKCIAKQVECQTEADCAVGQTCQSNRCVSKAPPECTEDIHCPSGNLCKNFKCEPLPKQCEKDSDCPTNNLCIDFNCVPVGIAPGDGGVQPDGSLNPGNTTPPGNTNNPWKNPFGPGGSNSNSGLTRQSSCSCNTTPIEQLPLTGLLCLTLLLLRRRTAA